MKKQLLICAIVGLMLSLASGQIAAQSAASDTTTPATKKSSKKAAADTATPAAATTAPAAGTSSHKGMVWVNTDSGIYHKEGSRYYGKTKEGKYMTEADAQKAGYKASKTN